MALAWSPEPAIVFRQQTDDLVPAVLNSGAGRLVPWGLESSAPYQRVGLAMGSVLRPTSDGFLPSGLVLGQRRPSLSSVVFHVANLPGYVGEPVTRDGTTWAGRTSFAWNGGQSI